MRVTPQRQALVIDGSHGVQIGSHNRQLNRFQFEIKRPELSLDDLLRGHPARQRAFAKLVANPDSVVANYVFRHCMPAMADPMRGPIRIHEASRPSASRVVARFGERGWLVVNRSHGVQVGSGNTQRNRFDYRVYKAELSLEHILRDRPDLTRCLAASVRYPGNAAVMRSLQGRLTAAYRAPTGVRHKEYLHAASIAVSHGSGVQLGSANARSDKVDAHLNRIVLKGWDAASRVLQQREPGLRQSGRPIIGRELPARTEIQPTAGRAIGYRAPARRPIFRSSRQIDRGDFEIGS